MFRLIGTLDLVWDALDPWAQDRMQLVRTARERRQPVNERAKLVDESVVDEVLPSPRS